VSSRLVSFVGYTLPLTEVCRFGGEAVACDIDFISVHINVDDGSILVIVSYQRAVLGKQKPKKLEMARNFILY